MPFWLCASPSQRPSSRRAQAPLEREELTTQVTGIVGESVFADAIRTIFSKSDQRPDDSDCQIVCSWESTDHLRHIVGGGAAVSLLIEGGEAGELYVGPVFSARAAGCLDCYLGRRQAKTGTECRPAAEAVIPVRQATLIRDHITLWLAGRSPLECSQAALSMTGEIVFHEFLPLPTCVRCCARATGVRRIPVDALVVAASVWYTALWKAVGLMTACISSGQRGRGRTPSCADGRRPGHRRRLRPSRGKVASDRRVGGTLLRCVLPD